MSSSERLTDEQLKARGLVLAEMVQQEATIAELRARVAQLEEELRLARMHPYGAVLKDAS